MVELKEIIDNASDCFDAVILRKKYSFKINTEGGFGHRIYGGISKDGEGNIIDRIYYYNNTEETIFKPKNNNVFIEEEITAKEVAKKILKKYHKRRNIKNSL